MHESRTVIERQEVECPNCHERWGSDDSIYKAEVLKCVFCNYEFKASNDTVTSWARMRLGNREYKTAIPIREEDYERDKERVLKYMRVQMEMYDNLPPAIRDVFKEHWVGLRPKGDGRFNLRCAPEEAGMINMKLQAARQRMMQTT